MAFPASLKSFNLTLWLSPRVEWSSLLLKSSSRRLTRESKPNRSEGQTQANRAKNQKEQQREGEGEERRQSVVWGVADSQEKSTIHCCSNQALRGWHGNQNLEEDKEKRKGKDVVERDRSREKPQTRKVSTIQETERVILLLFELLSACACTVFLLIEIMDG